MDAPPPHEDTGPVPRRRRMAGRARPCARRKSTPRIAGEGWCCSRISATTGCATGSTPIRRTRRRPMQRAIDALVALHDSPPGPFAPYDMAVYQREAALLTEWYCPGDGARGRRARATPPRGRRCWPRCCRASDPGVTVLRDYHAENIMLLADERRRRAGADRLPGRAGRPPGLRPRHPAAGCAARCVAGARAGHARPLPGAVEPAPVGGAFEADYARLGAQRNAKIVGIFVRLWQRDGKPRYLDLIPRVWDALERDLAHPALAPVAHWFDCQYSAAHPR